MRNDTEIRRLLDERGQFTGRIVNINLPRDFAGKGDYASDEPVSALLATISPRLAGLLGDESVHPAVRVSVFETPCEQKVLVITLRADACQQRIIAFLNDKGIADALHNAERCEALYLALRVGSTEEFVGWRVPLPAVEARKLQALAEHVRPLPVLHQVLEMALAAGELQARPEYFGCDEVAGAVDECWVTTILPGDGAANLPEPPASVH